MTTFGALPPRCERARQWTSLAVDGELSELEQALLDAHLEICDRCAAFTSGVRTATSALRKTEPALPSRPIALPRRRHAVPGRAMSLAAAAVATAAVGLGALFGTVSSGTPPTARHPAKAPLVDENTLLRLPRLAQLKAQAQAQARKGPQRGLGIVV